MRAQMGATARDPGLNDGRTATRTCLAFTAEDIGKCQVAATLALGIHVITIRRSALLNTQA